MRHTVADVVDTSQDSLVAYSLNVMNKTNQFLTPDNKP